MKRLTAIFLTWLMCLTLCACGGSAPDAPENGAGPDQSAGGETVTEAAVPVRIGSLKGPTSIGLAYLRSRSEADEDSALSFMLETDASALLAAMVKEELDIALIPANAAAIWYQKLEGDVVCLDVNTLGVLYGISGCDCAEMTIEDLAGRIVYLPGQGASPDYVLQYLLSRHGMSLEDVNVEYKSEAAEVVAALAANPVAVGILPQPSVTAALAKLEGFTVYLDLTAEWGAVCDTDLLTGVTVARRAFVENHPELVEAFLKEHRASADYAAGDTAENVAAVAALAEQYGIMDDAKVAEKAIPFCNVTCVTGQEMKDMVSAYLQVLFDLEPASVGGAVPDDGFYYLG